MHPAPARVARRAVYLTFSATPDFSVIRCDSCFSELRSQ
jgi:hypothetical protein